MDQESKREVIETTIKITGIKKGQRKVKSLSIKCDDLDHPATEDICEGEIEHLKSVALKTAKNIMKTVESIKVHFKAVTVRNSPFGESRSQILLGGDEREVSVEVSAL